MKNKLRSAGLLSFAALLVSAVGIQAFLSTTVSAAQISNRSITLQAGTTDGGSMPGGVVKHLITFTLPSTSAIGSIKFTYCMLAAGACVTPTGLVTTAATLSSQNGATGFTMVNTTNGAPYITRTSSAPASQSVSYQLSNVTNPTTTNQTFFVRITSYASTDTTGAATDSGVVAAATATQIVLTGTMPESLVFCAGATIGLTNSVPDCTTASLGAISFNQLFTPTDTAIAFSQMAASTNAGSGYSITVNGPTLTSGGNTIAGMTTPDTSKKGVAQFGLNLKANTASSASSFTASSTAEVAPLSNGTNYRAQALAGYNTVDTFAFKNNDAVANSSNGGLGGTDAQIYTASYIVNVPGSQPAGTYTTTLTYICTPTF